MISIGLRSTNDVIWYSIINADDKGNCNVIACSKLIIPKSLTYPEQLNYARRTFKDIIFEFNVSVAGIRTIESLAQNPSPVRIAYEAILQELLASSNIKKYLIGQISSITAKIGMQRDYFKQAIAKSGVYEKIDDWSKYNENQKESILVAIAATNL